MASEFFFFRKGIFSSCLKDVKKSIHEAILLKNTFPSWYIVILLQPDVIAMASKNSRILRQIIQSLRWKTFMCVERHEMRCMMLNAPCRERETRKMPSILHCIRCILCARHSWAALKRFTVHRIDSQCFFPFFVFVRFRKSILRFPSRFFLHSLQHDLWAVRFGIAIAATDQLCQIVFASMEFRVCVWHKICSSMHSIQVENSICFEFFHRIQFRDVFQGPRWH